MRPSSSGVVAASHASFVMVIDGTGTTPVVFAHRSGPRWRTSALEAAADSVSFQSFAGRSGAPAPSRTTSPCCCPATAERGDVAGAGLLDRRDECVPPLRRVLLAPGRSGGRVRCPARRQEATVVRVADLDLGRLRRRVDAEDEGHPAVRT